MQIPCTETPSSHLIAGSGEEGRPLVALIVPLFFGDSLVVEGSRSATFLLFCPERLDPCTRELGL